MIDKAEISDPEQILKVLSDFRKLPMSQRLLAAANTLQVHAIERDIPFDDLKMNPAAVIYASAAWARAEGRAENLRRCLAVTGSDLPQAPYLYCTLPEGHEDAHEATDLRTGEVLKAWSKVDV